MDVSLDWPFFSCPEQLNRWPCHSLTQCTESLTHSTLLIDIQNDLAMTWPWPEGWILGWLWLQLIPKSVLYISSNFGPLFFPHWNTDIEMVRRLVLNFGLRKQGAFWNTKREIDKSHQNICKSSGGQGRDRGLTTIFMLHNIWEIPSPLFPKIPNFKMTWNSWPILVSKLCCGFHNRNEVPK